MWTTAFFRSKIPVLLLRLLLVLFPSMHSKHTSHTMVSPLPSFVLPIGANGGLGAWRKTCSRRQQTWKAYRPPICCAEKQAPDAGAEKQNKDIIERVWEMVFGPKQAEPFGLKRFDRDRFPELYPATLTEFADPVESDDEYAALFRPLMARTQLQTRELQLLYDANRDGWSAEAFHAKVDKRGACVILARTEGAVFGGYSPKGFVGYGESRGSKAAFLFTWPTGDTSQRAIKLRKVGGAGLAVLDQPDTGPRFGSDGLFVPLRPPRATWAESNNDRLAMSKLGSYYERKPDGGNCLFADGEPGKGMLLTELRAYAGVYAEGEEIPFSDACPFSLE